MIYHILRQIWAQRKYNTWIFIELFIVFILVWVIVDFNFEIIHNRSVPMGFDADNTYVLSYNSFEKGTSRYDDMEGDPLKMMENLNRIIRKVKQYQNVEVAALSYGRWGSLPYSGGFYGTGVIRDTIKTNAEMKRFYSGDYFRIFRYTSTKDNSWQGPASADLDKNNSIFITNIVSKKLFGTESPIGKTIKIQTGQTEADIKEYVVIDVLNDQKRFEYSLPAAAVFLPAPPLTPSNLRSSGVICLRAKEGISERQFLRDLKKDMPREFRIGNYYLEEVESFNDIKKNTEYKFGLTNEIRTRFALMIFFLLCMSLGVIGTFWFRNQTRLGEIGLRMAIGSTGNKLQLQFITESVLLLTIAVLPALIVNFVLARTGIVDGYNRSTHLYIIENAPLRFMITNVITYIFLAIIVTLSAWIPAHRASKVHPVDALRDE